MQRKFLLTLFGFFVFVIHPLMAQSFMFKGIIIDSTTNKPLQSVKIYLMSERDTVQITNNISGTFQIEIIIGSKLHFRKGGYAWHSIKITNDSKKEVAIHLLPSKPVQLNIGDKEYSTVVIYDNEVVPQNEWNDVLSICPKEISSVKTYIKDRQNILVIESKP